MPGLWLRCLYKTGTRTTQKPSVMTSLLSGFTFLAAWACDHFKWDWSGALTNLVKKCINCSVELPSAVTVAKVTTGLSVLGLCLSAMLEARFGVRATIMNAKIRGPHQVYCRELEIAGTLPSAG